MGNTTFNIPKIETKWCPCQLSWWELILFELSAGVVGIGFVLLMIRLGILQHILNQIK